MVSPAVYVPVLRNPNFSEETAAALPGARRFCAVRQMRPALGADRRNGYKRLPLRGGFSSNRGRICVDRRANFNYTNT